MPTPASRTYPAVTIRDGFDGGDFSYFSAEVAPPSGPVAYEGEFWQVSTYIEEFEFVSGWIGPGLAFPHPDDYGNAHLYFMIARPIHVYEENWTSETMWEAFNYAAETGLPTFQDFIDAALPPGTSEEDALLAIGITVPLGEAGVSLYQEQVRDGCDRMSWRMKPTPGGEGTFGNSGVSVFAGDASGLVADGGTIYPVADSDWHQYEFEIVSGAVVFRLDGVVTDPTTLPISVDFGDPDKVEISGPGFFVTDNLIVDDVELHFPEFTDTWEQVVVPGVESEPEPSGVFVRQVRQYPVIE